jgi:cell shape-determining protein MreC
VIKMALENRPYKTIITELLDYERRMESLKEEYNSLSEMRNDVIFELKMKVTKGDKNG